MYSYDKKLKNKLSVVMAIVALVSVVCTIGCNKEKSLTDTRRDNIDYDMNQHKTRNVKFTGALSLDQIISFAIENNLDLKAKQLEINIQKELTSQAWLRSLPTLIGEYGKTHRSNALGSDAISLDTGLETLSTSRDSETSTRRGSLSASWDVVEFSSAFFMALQAGDKERIAKQNLKRIKQDLVLDITKKYWQCVVMGEATTEAEKILKDVDARLDAITEGLKDKSILRIDGLKLKKKFTIVKMRLKGYRNTWEELKANLKLSMGLSPMVEIKLASVDIPILTKLEKMEAASLEQEALCSRPELFQQDYNEKIAHNDVRVAIASFFPSLPVSVNHNYSNNPFLYANNWYTLGLKASTDILSIPQKIANFHSLALKQKLIREQRMKLSIGILAQVNLALIQYYADADLCLANSSLVNVQNEIVKVDKKMLDAGKKTSDEYLSAEIDYFFANLEYMISYAEMMGAKAQVENSVGREVAVSAESIPVLTD